MSDEVNKMLEGKWFVVDADGVIINYRDEAIARALCVTRDSQYPSSAPPHHAVQLQVKGTLPEGAIMPKYKVGDRVTFKGSEVFRVTGVKNVYTIESPEGKYGCGAAEHELQSAPPADPMRDEFEAWCKKERYEIDRRGDDYLRTDTAYAWAGWQAAKGGTK